jgi:hypothetical protein
MAKKLDDLIEQVRKELNKLVGLKVSSTVGAAKDDEGWHISVEMLEKESVPDQMDILSIYEAITDEEGKILGFTRTGMRKRMDIRIKEVKE